MPERIAAQPVITPAPVALDNANTVGGSGGKGRICIAARSRIENLTRAPRLAKALVDAGYDVTIVSLASPGPQLRAMCPEVEYIEVKYTPKTRELANRLALYRQKRSQRHSKQEKARQAQLVKGGPKALAIRLLKLGQVPLRSLGRVFWRTLVVTPCALLLKKRLEGFASTWRSLAAEDAVQIMTRFVLVPNQWSASYSFAEAADKVTRGRRFDVVQAYDNYGLLAGTRLTRRDGAKLIYDAVEITSHRLGAALNLCFAERLCERLQRRQERRLFGKADAMTTVGNGLADWYVRHYRIPRPLVVRNCRYYWPYQIDSRLRADAGIGAEIRVLVWCGLIYPEQGIELLIKAMPHLASSIHLAIIGIFNPSQKSYAQEVLPGLAAKLGAGARVHILPPREPNDLVPYISGGDLGVIPRPSEHPNNFYSMPNKFLEMVMARLPVAVSRLGDIASTIDEFHIGATFNERAPADIAAVIQGMLEPAGYAVLKANVMKAAESLNWEQENPPYVGLVTSLMPPRHHVPLAAQARDNPVVRRPAAGDRTVKAQEHSRPENAKPGEPVARNGLDDARALDANQRPHADVEQLLKSQA
ncbi:MAG TPA: glycosyltransferase family 4 protein, partial [Stellaceae bacterium]|nr:glycosyltransferase family 4 protein [Stellaceae bacterium]